MPRCKESYKSRYTEPMSIIDFVKGYPLRSFRKGEVILSENDISDTLIAIRDGYVKVTAIDDHGNERMLWIAGRYDIVPTERLFSRSQPLRFFYTALSDGDAYRINKADFLHCAKTDLSVMTEIATSMSAHYDDLLSRVNTVEQPSVRDKLIATLHYLAGRFSAEDSVDLYKVGLQLTHKDIAELIGSTRETISVELQKLRKEGLIDYSRTHFIVHLTR